MAIAMNESLDSIDKLAEEFIEQGRSYLINSIQYETGIAGQQDSLQASECLKRSVDLFKRAADRGYPLGQYLVGLAYQQGTGIEKDVPRGIRYFQKAADRGHVEALFKLGMAYKNGQGVLKNPAASLKLFRKAAALGHEEAIYQLRLAESPDFNLS